MTPPVGKSGPFTRRNSVRSWTFGFSISAISAWHSSPRLCGGTEVAMPTAMPVEPFASRLGNAAGRTDGFRGLAVVVGAEIDGVLIDAVEQLAGDLGQARFGVAVGGGVVAVNIAEIALPIDERIARGKVLRETHQRVVDRLIAMRMEIAHHVADDLRRFLERRNWDRDPGSACRRECGDGRASARRAHRAERAAVMVESA